MQALVKVTMISPSNIDEMLKKYATLRMYLSGFQRTADGGFISKAEVFKKPSGGYVLKDRESLDLRLSLLDWGFNEEAVFVGMDSDGNPIHEFGDAHHFYEECPEGFKWSLQFLCAI